ncbi:Flexible cuticle protein 12 [Eumeta japonica]|uniref:Flexible cuticle protein 12 n=1 Tax=Eumeta variegata TaxID=151549 RepID=A0A4C1T526_EUMVA|nr:Flexible cuticle protein 12 [Eumeta japonica]
MDREGISGSFIVLAVLVAVAAAAPADSDAQIVRQDQDVDINAFSYAYETSNGIAAQEQGQLQNAGTENEAIVVQVPSPMSVMTASNIEVDYTARPGASSPKARIFRRLNCSGNEQAASPIIAGEDMSLVTITNWTSRCWTAFHKRLGEEIILTDEEKPIITRMRNGDITQKDEEKDIMSRTLRKCSGRTCELCRAIMG